jgi:hypothetical protein
MSFTNTINKLKDIILQKEFKDKINNILSSLPPSPKSKINVISGVGEKAKIETIPKNKLVLLDVDNEITNEMGKIYLYMVRNTAYVYFEKFNRLILLAGYLYGSTDEARKKEAETKLNNGFKNGIKSIVMNNLVNISGIKANDNNDYLLIKPEDIKTIVNLASGFPDPAISDIYVYNQKVYVTNYLAVKTYNSDIKIGVDFDFSIKLTNFRKISKSPIVKIDKENAKLLDVNNEGVDITLLTELPKIIIGMQNFAPKYRLNITSMERTIIQNVNKAVDLNNPKYELNATLFQGDSSGEYVNVVGSDTKRLTIGKIQGNIPADKKYIVLMKWVTDKKIKEILFNDKYAKITSDKFIYFLCQCRFAFSFT